jgi:hypothetical protein
MEPEGSIPYSQEPATNACPEPDESSPHALILCFKLVIQLSVSSPYGVRR